MRRRGLISFVAPALAALNLVLVISAMSPILAVAQSSTLLVGAAASLQDVLKELNPIFEKANPGIKVNYNFAASGPLTQQIEQGAPMDVFISAATRQMDSLQKSNLILVDSRRNLLTNRLVLVVPRNSTLGLTSFRQLTNPDIKRISVGEPRSVPVGQYSEEVFKNLKISEQVKPKLVYGNSVRNVLASVESGNADVGIVYVTDAKISDQVKQVATAPENLHSPIVYPAAAVAYSRNLSAANTYLQFLTTKPARQVFLKYGFGLAQS